MNFRCDTCGYEAPNTAEWVPLGDDPIVVISGPKPYCANHKPPRAMRPIDPAKDAEAAICAKRGHQPSVAGGLMQQQMGSKVCRWCGATYRPIAGVR